MSQLAMRPYGFSQPSYVTAKSQRRLDQSFDDSDLTPCSSDNESKYPARASKSHSRSSSTSQPRTKAGLKLQISHKQPRTFPDEELGDDVYSSHHYEQRRPSRLQASRHGRHPSLASPITPTTVKKLGEMQLRTPPPDFSPAHGSMAEQIADVRSALRRAEADCQKLRDQLEAGRADRYRLERELEEARRENRRLAVRLEELLKSPLSARSDDAWGCSMYDHEVDGRY